MDAAERKAAIDRLSPWFAEMSVALHLGHWEIRVPYETRPDDNMNASIERVYGQNVARIFLSDAFLEDSPEEQRETYTHELLHCHFRQIIEIRDGMSVVLGLPAFAIFDQQMKNAEEWAVDGISRAIAPLLPLPPSGDTSKAGSR